jgi:hypothetical protein
LAFPPILREIFREPVTNMRLGVDALNVDRKRDSTQLANHTFRSIT